MILLVPNMNRMILDPLLETSDLSLQTILQPPPTLISPLPGM